VSFGDWLLVDTILALGALVQGAVGFGFALVSAPLLILVNPALVPGPLLVASLLLTLLMTRREWHAVRGADLGWSLPGRAVGTVVALAVLRTVPPDRLALAIGVVILAAVAVSATGWHVALSPRSLFGAGTISGFMGTTSSIGGPPLALVYQREAGPRLRGTLAAYFTFGILISLTGLHAIGRFGRPEATLALGLLPGVVPGFAVSHRLARVLDRGYTRPALLAVAGASALAVILRELL